MERAALRQKQINRKRVKLLHRYPELWRRMIAEWQSDSESDCAWLLYSANYLLRTGDVRWAIDPATLKNRVALAPEAPAARDLRPISFILLTHSHADHLDLNLLRSLRELPIWWVIPPDLVQTVHTQAGIPKERLVVPELLQPLEFDGVRLTPFEGLHVKVPEVSYLVEFKSKRWLFPGDTRLYDYSRLPLFGKLDGVFAHLWLGKARALEDRPALLDPFCQFFLGFAAPRIVVTHLEEMGRTAEDYWDRRHFRVVQQWFRQNRPGIHIESARIGDRVSL